MWALGKTACWLPGERFYPVETAIQQNGRCVALKVVAKAKGSFTATVEVTSSEEWGYPGPGLQHAGVGTKVNFAPRRI